MSELGLALKTLLASRIWPPDTTDQFPLELNWFMAVSAPWVMMIWVA